MDHIVICKTIVYSGKSEYILIMTTDSSEKIVISESDARSISYKYQEIQRLRDKEASKQ